MSKIYEEYLLINVGSSRFAICGRVSGTKEFVPTEVSYHEVITHTLEIAIDKLKKVKDQTNNPIKVRYCPTSQEALDKMINMFQFFKESEKQPATVTTVTATT